MFPARTYPVVYAGFRQVTVQIVIECKAHYNSATVISHSPLETADPYPANPQHKLCSTILNIRLSSEYGVG